MSEKFRTKSGQQPVRLASTSGHVVNVGSDWTDVPASLETEALKAGLLSKEVYDAAVKDAANMLSERREQENKGDKESTGTDNHPQVDRDGAILLAIAEVNRLSEEGEDKTPGGKRLLSADGERPLVDAVSELAGFQVKASEIEALA
ncbi:MAG: hypothetical protein ACK5PS_08930 [Desulfopila sp.]